VASKLNIPKSSTPTPTTGSKDLEFAKLDNNLAVARVKVLNDVFNTIGKGFYYLRAKKDERTRLETGLGHHALNKLDEAQTTAIQMLNFLIDEAGRSSDFEQRRRIIGDANESLRALATIRQK
jgi:hypothetical protein